MAEMVASALVQEAVSSGVSHVLGNCKEKRMPQGHIVERMEMAVSELELAVERSAKLPITDVSLLCRRKIIKSAYVEAMGQLEKHKPQAVSGGQQRVAQGIKRPRWMFWAKQDDMFMTPFAGFSMNDVRRFEWYADCARKFVRDVESGCSLHHYTFCNPIVRHLLEGKTLRYRHLEQGNLLRYFYMWPLYSDERGVEAVLKYQYGDSTMGEKHFILLMFLRLSESTDIVGVAIKGLQLLTPEFKLAAESAMGELTMLFNLQDIANSHGPPSVGFQDQYIKDTQYFRPDPTCCKGTRDRLYASNSVSSELSDIFPEQVIHWCFECNYVPAQEPRLSHSSFDVVGRTKSRGSGKQLLLLTVAFKFAPHHVIDMEDSNAVETIGDVKEYTNASIQQVAEALKSDAIKCFFHQTEPTGYETFCRFKHGCSAFKVEKASKERAGAPKSKRRYNTRASASRSDRR